MMPVIGLVPGPHQVALGQGFKPPASSGQTLPPLRIIIPHRAVRAMMPQAQVLPGKPGPAGGGEGLLLPSQGNTKGLPWELSSSSSGYKHTTMAEPWFHGCAFGNF